MSVTAVIAVTGVEPDQPNLLARATPWRPYRSIRTGKPLRGRDKWRVRAIRCSDEKYGLYRWRAQFRVGSIS
jgi:hypothetical protein